MPDEFANDSPTSYSESSYNADNFYVAAVDSKGHSGKVSVHVPPQTKGRLDAIIASRSYPIYRTQNDIVRDAIVHRLHHLSEQYQDVNPVWSGEMEIMVRELIVESDLEMERRKREHDNKVFDHCIDLLRDAEDYPETGEMVAKGLLSIRSPRLRAELQREMKHHL